MSPTFDSVSRLAITFLMEVRGISMNFSPGLAVGLACAAGIDVGAEADGGAA